MSRPTYITSTSQLDKILSSSTYVIMDFYADWCGPCKAISPVFDQLCASESKPGRMQFVKVDVDSNRDIAQRYGVSAMPTFQIMKNSKVHNTIRGANASSLKSAIQAASSDSAKGPAAQSTSFQSKGHVLGSASTSSTTSTTASKSSSTSTFTNARSAGSSRNSGRTLGSSSGSGTGGLGSGLGSLWNQAQNLTSSGSGGIANDIVRFWGLYFQTLFSLDSYAAAEQSAFAVDGGGRR